MKTEIKTKDWYNGQRKYEIPHVNGQRHGLARWWYEKGQRRLEVSYVNGQVHGFAKWWHKNGKNELEIPYIKGQCHGLEKWWRDDGSLGSLKKWHQGQRVWDISFPSEEYIPGDSEIELFFQPTPELS